MFVFEYITFIAFVGRISINIDKNLLASHYLYLEVWDLDLNRFEYDRK